MTMSRKERMDLDAYLTRADELLPDSVFDAAPELFDALERMADLFKDLASDQTTETGWKTEEMLAVYQQARAALSRAEGG